MNHEIKGSFTQPLHLGAPIPAFATANSQSPDERKFLSADKGEDPSAAELLGYLYSLTGAGS